jgi:diacylglycerol kinase (ATP)
MSTSKNQPFISRLRFAIAGLTHALRTERSLQVQLGALTLVVVAMASVGVEPEWWAIVLVASGLVITAELLNTAIEHLADHVHPQVHPGIRIVKDCAAAGVLVASLTAFGVGVALVIRLFN